MGPSRTLWVVHSVDDIDVHCIAARRPATATAADRHGGAALLHGAPRGYGGSSPSSRGWSTDSSHVDTTSRSSAAGTRGTAAQEFVRTRSSPQRSSWRWHCRRSCTRPGSRACCRHTRSTLVHDHTLAGPLTAVARRSPTVVTVHGAMDELSEIYRPLGSTVSLVAVSDAQRQRAPDLNWVGTVHNGIDVDSFPYRADKDDYVLFLGRFHPQKAPHSRSRPRAGRGPHHPGRQVHREDRARVLRRAGRAAPGTERRRGGGRRPGRQASPAGRRPLPRLPDPVGGAVRTRHGRGDGLRDAGRGPGPRRPRPSGRARRTGFVVERPEELAAAISAVATLDPADCRRHVSSRFSLDAMATGYEGAYRRVLAHQGAGSTASSRPAPTRTVV